MRVFITLFAISIFGVIFEAMSFAFSVRKFYKTDSNDSKEYNRNNEICEKTLFKLYTFSFCALVILGLMFILK